MMAKAEVPIPIAVFTRASEIPADKESGKESDEYHEKMAAITNG